MSDAETTLRKVLDKIIAELQYNNADISLKALTSGGANYTSALYSVNITAPGNEPLKLFAKVANVNEFFRKVMDIDVLFRTEQFVYSDLVKVYEKIQDKHKLSPEHRFVFPKFFGGEAATGEETVVMEDLTASGYCTYSRFKPVDWEHISRTVDQLAKFHALSFAYQKEDPESFAKDTVLLTFKKKERSKDANMDKTWNKMVSGAIQVAKEEHKERLSKFIEPESKRDEFYKLKAPLSTPVICHGDYRISNLLFRRLNGRLDPIVVDYQTVHTGCPVTDLLYLEFLGTDQEFRRENHQRLVDHYFKELTAALDRLGIDVNDVYPRETFDKEFREMMSSTLIIAMVVLPLVLVEAEHAPHMGEVKEFGELALSPGEAFAKRFSELVSDCVDWGVI